MFEGNYKATSPMNEEQMHEWLKQYEGTHFWAGGFPIPVMAEHAEIAFQTTKHPLIQGFVNDETCELYWQGVNG